MSSFGEGFARAQFERDMQESPSVSDTLIGITLDQIEKLEQHIVEVQEDHDDLAGMELRHLTDEQQKIWEAARSALLEYYDNESQACLEVAQSLKADLAGWGYVA